MLPAATKVPMRRSSRDPSSAPRPASAGPAATSRSICGDVLWRCVPGRERVGDEPGQLGPEDQAAVGGVVVGDEDERLLGVGVAGRARDVVGRAVGEEAAEQMRAARDVVDDPRGRQQPERRGAPAAERREHARRRQQPERQRHRADRGLLLDRGGHPSASQLAADPLRRLPLALRGGGPVEAREVLDGGAQAVEVRLHGLLRVFKYPAAAMASGSGLPVLQDRGGGRARRCASTRTSAPWRSWTSTPPPAATCS